MYQPYQGTWIQPIACFLSRGAASSDVLCQIIMEAIILMENAGFRVNNITTDGATWNRSMWSKFGITDGNVSCEHIVDEGRRLWFVSDFPHLIKNVRNWMTGKHLPSKVYMPMKFLKKFRLKCKNVPISDFFLHFYIF